MPRSIWSGSISFGLVNIPVKLFTAVSPKDVHFHQLHDADGVRIQQKRVCPVDQQEVPYENIVKGYEVAPNQYVRIDSKELDALNPEKTHTIDIDSFVELTAIDPLYFEKSYYIVPDKGAAKAYTLLFTAMRDSGKVALARTVLRTRQSIAALRPTGEALSLSTLYFADEVVSQKELEGLVHADVTTKELDMARRLIDSLASDFHPERYQDEYRIRLLELIDQKAKGQEVVVQPVMPERPRVINLLDALEASLAQTSGGASTAPAPAAGAPIPEPRRATAKGKRKPAARQPAAPRKSEARKQRSA